MDFTWKRREVVVPSPLVAPHTVALSGIDQIMPAVYTGFLFFFSRPAHDPPDTEVLTRSLARTLAAFPPAAGRLKPRSDGFGMDMECCNQGAVFVEAQATSVTLDMVLTTGNGDVRGGMFQPSPLWTSLAPNPYAEEYSLDKPLLHAQLTRLACGGVTMAVQLHHLVADGAAMLHLVASWAELARGCSITTPPHLDRSCMRARTPPRPTCQHPEYIVYPSLAMDAPPQIESVDECRSSATDAPLPPMTSRIFEFLPQDIAKLKERVSAHQENRFTGFQTLAAHIWKHVTKACLMEAHQVTRLGWAVDGRKRFNPPLPENYFGNVNFYGHAEARAGDLYNAKSEMEDAKKGTQYMTLEDVTAGLHNIAGLVKSGTERMTNEYMQSALDLVASQVSPALVVPNFVGMADWAITSWVHFPVYDVDWGWGQPQFFALPVYAFRSLVVLLPHPHREGMNAFVGMAQPHMDALLSDFDFYPVQ